MRVVVIVAIPTASIATIIVVVCGMAWCYVMLCYIVLCCDMLRHVMSFLSFGMTPGNPK